MAANGANSVWTNSSRSKRSWDIRRLNVPRGFSASAAVARTRAGGYFAGRRSGIERHDKLLGRDGAIAFIDPGLEYVEGRLLFRRECRAHPAALAQAVSGRFGERIFEREFARVGQL